MKKKTVSASATSAPSSPLRIDRRSLKLLLSTLEAKGVSEFEYEDERFRLRIHRGPSGRAVAYEPAFAPAVASAPTAQAPAAPALPDEDVIYITSPFVGTFYRSPSPEADAFAELNPDLAAAEATNPDDPERRNPDVSAWWTIDGIQGAGPVIRPEVLASTDWTQFAPPVDPVQVAQTVTENDPDEQEPAMTAAADEAPAPALDTTDPQDAEVPEGTPALAQDIAEDGLPFYGIIAPEGVPSDDGRMFSMDAMITRDLPLPLMCQDAQLSGHDGAVRVGRIDEVWRDDTTYATPMIRYRGVWDDLDANEYAVRMARSRRASD